MASPPPFDDVVILRGPSFHVDLAAIDALHPIHYSRRLLIFRCASSAQRDAQLAALKTGLQGLLLRCPILGGVIVPLPPDVAIDGKPDWRTIAPGTTSLELIVRDLRAKLPSFEKLEAANFPASQLPYDLLVPVPHGLGNDRPFAACKMQFSAIDGGTILTFSISHSVADGGGTNELMRALSEETRLAQEKSGEGVSDELRSTAVSSDMGLDRSVLRNMKSELVFKIEDHPGYRWKPTPSTSALPEEESPTLSFQATSSEVPVLLRIPPAALARLKADATLPGAPHISTHDALTALMWRTVLLIRSRRTGLSKDILDSVRGDVFMPSDARGRLGLPESYIGNAVYQLAVSLDLGTLLSPSGLQHGASAIRQAITAVNPALASSLLAKTNETWIDWQFVSTMSTTGVAMGTDWTSSVLYGQDWGKEFGPLVRYRYPGGVGEAFTCVLPKLPDGTAEVMVCVMPNEIEVVKGPEGFGKYLDSVA